MCETAKDTSSFVLFRQVLYRWFSHLEKMNLKGPLTSVRPVFSETQKLLFTVHVILRRKIDKGNFS